MNSKKLGGQKIGVIGGAGHVGLPLALALAAADADVTIYDINVDKLSKLSRGLMPFAEAGADKLLRELLAKNKLKLSSNAADLANCTSWIVSIYPANNYNTAGAIADCLRELLPHASHEQTVILRSTIPPGTTDTLHHYLNGHGKRVHVVYAPERVLQGQSLSELAALPQILGPVTTEGGIKAAELFRAMTAEIVLMTPKEAELAKLYCNAFRYMEFAISNEFQAIAHSLDVDYESLRSKLVHNYPRAQHLPKAGPVGGPCLQKDVKLLGEVAPVDHFIIGQAAQTVNNAFIQKTMDKILRPFKTAELTVGLLGVAYKPNCEDTRGSMTRVIKHFLQSRGVKRVLLSDPQVAQTVELEILPLDKVIAQSDILIVCVDHTAYNNLNAGTKPLFRLSAVQLCEAKPDPFVAAPTSQVAAHSVNL